jgi:hypothetical protein
MLIYRENKNMARKKITFSIPYNGDIDLVRWAISSGQVYEVYFAGDKNNNFSDPYVDLKSHTDKEITELLRVCAKGKVRTNFLVNKNTLFFEDVLKMKKYIGYLQKKWGVDVVTVSDPYIVPIIRKEFPRLSLQSSIFMGIDNVQKAREALKMGITELCLDPALNRNASELKKIMALKKTFPRLRVKLLGIHGCYLNCFFAWKHSQLPVLKDFLDDSGYSKKPNMLGRTLDHDMCSYCVKGAEDELKRPFIRPEDITYYEKHGLADHIKVAYRNDSSERLAEKLTSYFTRKLDGNLFELFGSNKHQPLYCDNARIPAGFIDKTMKCDKNCDMCDYCGRLAKLIISTKK